MDSRFSGNEKAPVGQDPRDPDVFSYRHLQEPFPDGPVAHLFFQNAVRIFSLFTWAADVLVCPVFLATYPQQSCGAPRTYLKECQDLLTIVRTCSMLHIGRHFEAQYKQGSLTYRM